MALDGSNQALTQRDLTAEDKGMEAGIIWSRGMAIEDDRTR
jgi:hypothetical protein